MNLEKREANMIAKYGSAEALAEKRREWQAKSRANYSGDGGFRALKTRDPQAMSDLARKAANIRHGNKEKTGGENTVKSKDITKGKDVAEI